jgi:histidine triad (HIT) family protein
MDDCIFCSIVNGNEPYSLVYEDAISMAFMTIEPVNDGHVLVIPKNHFAYLADMDEATGAHLFTTSQRIAKAIRSTDLKCEGINLFLADGEAAFQEVFHLHLHIFPRYKGDSFKLDANWEYRPERSQLDVVASKVRTAYMKLWSDKIENL